MSALTDTQRERILRYGRDPERGCMEIARLTGHSHVTVRRALRSAGLYRPANNSLEAIGPRK